MREDKGQGGGHHSSLTVGHEMDPPAKMLKFQILPNKIFPKAPSIDLLCCSFLPLSPSVVSNDHEVSTRVD